MYSIGWRREPSLVLVKIILGIKTKPITWSEFKLVTIFSSKILTRQWTFTDTTCRITALDANESSVNRNN